MGDLTTLGVAEETEWTGWDGAGKVRMNLGNSNQNASMKEARATKAGLRAEMLATLKRLSAAERAEASARACALLEQQRVWQEARTLLFYAPLADEPDIWRLLMDALAAGKTVALPRYEKEQDLYVACQIREADADLRTGRFGVREPRETCDTIPLNRLDLMLVPGLAFDMNGHRLGRGKGYYDRLLSVAGARACGVAFDEQLVGRVPSEPHDVRVNCILTPTRWHAVSEPRADLKS
jgi:5-formyltetrahydrofolate cyclo-ligase